jgi:spore germination protein KC
MKLIKLMILILIIFTFTGCWQYRELNKLAIVTAFGIDKVGEEYLLSIQVLNLASIDESGKIGAGGEPAVITYEAKAKTLRDAKNKIVYEIPRELYLGHMDLVILGEEMARAGMLDIMDFLMRDRRSRKLFTFAIVENGRAVDALKVLTPIDKIPAQNISDSAETTHFLNVNVRDISFDFVVMCLAQTARQPAAIGIKLIGDPKKGEETDNIEKISPDTKIVLTGTAVFSEDKLVGFLTPEQGLGYNLIRKVVSDFYLAFPCDNQGNYANFSMFDLKIKFDTKLKDGKPFTEIEIDVKGSLNELNCEMNLLKKEVHKEIEKMASKQLKANIEDTIRATQKEHKSDILGFGEMLYRNHYKDWKKVEDNWINIYPDVESKVKVTVKLADIQAFLDSTKGGMKPGKE